MQAAPVLPTGSWPIHGQRPQLVMGLDDSPICMSWGELWLWAYKGLWEKQRRPSLPSGQSWRCGPRVRIEKRAEGLGLGKKMHNLKVKNYVLLGRLSEDSSPEGSLSDSSEGFL